MAQPYVGEIRMFAGNFAPAGWRICDGAILPISENETLFQLIGTTYGGDGQETFNLPDLRGRTPMHMGQGPIGITYLVGENGGAEEVTLGVSHIPSHTHSVMAATTGQVASPLGAVLASASSTQGGVRLYSSLAATGSMHAATVQGIGGGQPHENMQPSLAINFIMSLFGIFPSPT